MKFSVTPVKFFNRKGCQLFGMLHEPEERSHGPAIILLSPGIKSRVAPHRMYVKMADRFCAMGFVVLRLDPEGLGDSEGEIEEYLTADVYGSLQRGRLVNDTIDSMDWMQASHGIGSFILSGLCGGAITGLLAGAMDERVVSFLGLGIPCIVSGSKIDLARYITKGELNSLRQSYFKKLFKPSAWSRFMFGKSDYRILLKSIMLPLRKLIRSKLMSEKISDQFRDIVETNAAQTNFNDLFPYAFFKMALKRKIFLIFSEADRLYWEYTEKFAVPYSKEIEIHKKNIEVKVVKNANHIFSFDIWQTEMLDLSCKWLESSLNAN